MQVFILLVVALAVVALGIHTAYGAHGLEVLGASFLAFYLLGALVAVLLLAYHTRKNPNFNGDSGVGWRDYAACAAFSWGAVFLLAVGDVV